MYVNKNIFKNCVFHSNVIVNKLAIYFSFCRFKLNYIYNIHFLYRRKETNVVNSKHCFVISDYIFFNRKFKNKVVNVLSSILVNCTMLNHLRRNTYK